MVICNIQFLCLKPFIATALQCIGKPEKFKGSDEGKALVIQHFSISRQGGSTLENILNLH